MINKSMTFALKKTIPADLLRKMIASGKSVPSIRGAINSPLIDPIASMPTMVEEREPNGGEDLVWQQQACMLRTSKK
jgi:hypothetical protein